jgi:hypothetical protein
VPGLSSEIQLVFLDRNKVEYDRDTRPADGRLGHHWFFAIDNATNGQQVELKWLPSLKLRRTTRQYQFLQLVEFDAAGQPVQTISPLDPTGISLTPTGDPIPAVAHTYTATNNSAHFRLDVMKANLVATNFTKGSTGWKFFSAPNALRWKRSKTSPSSQAKRK